MLEKRRLSGAGDLVVDRLGDVVERGDDGEGLAVGHDRFVGGMPV